MSDILKPNEQPSFDDANTTWRDTLAKVQLDPWDEEITPKEERIENVGP